MLSTSSNGGLYDNEECERLLNIKIKVVSRVRKDLKSYEAEADKQLLSIRALEAEKGGNEDPDLQFKIKKAYESFDETKRMIPECRQRLTAAMVDLEKFIEDFSSVLGEARVGEVKTNILNQCK